MKQKLIFLLAVILLLTGFSACGKTENAAASSGGTASSIDASSSCASSSDDTVIEPDSSTPAEPSENGAQDAQKPSESAGESNTAAVEKPQQNAAQTTAPAKNNSHPATQPASKPAEKPASKPAQSKPLASEAKPSAKPETKTPNVTDVAASVEKAMHLEAEMMTFSASDLSDLYGLDSTSVEGFVGKTPMMSVQASEYLVVKAVSGQAETVKKGMLKRQADLDTTWKQYLAEQYELVKNYKLVESGDYLLFAVGDNASAAVEAFNKAIK